MRPRVLVAVARRDLAAVRRSKAIVLPLALVPVILILGVPLAAVFSIRLAPTVSTEEINTLLRILPTGTRFAVESLPAEAQPAYVLLAYLMAPIFLFAPMVVSAVLAADSFAGERERGTIETLLHTPTTDAELFAGKVLGPWSVALAVALGCFVLHSAWTDLLLWPLAHQIVLPDLTWTALAFWVAPAFSALEIGAVVLVSSRVRSMEEASQLGGVVVLPVVVLAVGQVSGVVALSPAHVLALGGVVWIAAGLVLTVGARTFRRDAILSRS